MKIRLGLIEKQELIKTLGYITSFCAVLILIFALTYFTMPTALEEFYGLGLDFPYSGIFDGLLLFLVTSSTKLSTYIFLLILAAISLYLALILENDIKQPFGKTQEIETEEKLTSTDTKGTQKDELEPAEKEPARIDS